MIIKSAVEDVENVTSRCLFLPPDNPFE